MKKKFNQVSDRITIVGYNRMRGPEEVIDYYLYHPKWGKEYAFTRRYSLDTYNMVKGGIPVNRLLQIRSKNKRTMMLVKYLSLMMPYFMEEIEWMATA